MVKYVDDNVINLFRRIVHQAQSRGMRVNAQKTKALLISELKSYLPETFFDDADNNRIETDKTMKILGFHFSEDADMAAQVAAIRRKFVSRVWILRNLRSRVFGTEDLLKVYKSVIQPVHNYRSCVYNSSLAITQSGVLERL